MDQTLAGRLGGGLIAARGADVGAARERARQRRLAVLAAVLAGPCAFLWYRIADGRPFSVLALPDLPDDPLLVLLPLVVIASLAAVVLMPFAAGRSPHVRFGPDQIDVGFSDVVGLDGVVDEVIGTLNTFLAHAQFRSELGGTPRKGLLFEGPPGTGKTLVAKAMAREAGVPFLYASSTSFQSMWYGATARRIRSYFRALRRTARREGGAIGFLEEIDAIAMARGGLTAGAGGRVTPMASTEGAGGVVNELLIQLQSFDTPPPLDRAVNAVVRAVNSLLPAGRQLRERSPAYANLLVIAATNRGDDLDPALLRPGRFDRRLTFALPAKAARRRLFDHYLARKSHAPELDADDVRDGLAAQTLGYSPVAIEHLLDEALVAALRAGRDALSLGDLAAARLEGEIGAKHPVVYTERERLVVATHEAGHATVAHLAGTRRLEVLSIVKRAGSLGLLAHGDVEEVWTRSRREMYALVDIALGGMVAEELAFGEAGTGPGSDLAAATGVAAEIVGSSGMAGSLVSLSAVASGPLADTNLTGRVLADPATRSMLEQVLNEAKARVRAQLAANRHLVDALRDALLARDELVGDEITAVLQTAGPPVLTGPADLRAAGPAHGTDRRRV